MTDRQDRVHGIDEAFLSAPLTAVRRLINLRSSRTFRGKANLNRGPFHCHRSDIGLCRAHC